MSGQSGTAPIEYADAPRTVSVLGATGSIGISTLDLIERHPERFQVDTLTANSNVDELARLARLHRARCAVIADPERYDGLRAALSGTGIEVAAGHAALNEAGAVPVDFMMAGIVGAAGLEPTLAAVRQGTTIGLANKECLVCAGNIFMQEIRRSGSRLLPVDSEHNAIFQVFENDRVEQVSRIILTASGGPFRTSTMEEMARATPAEAVAHPNWSMGAKISVDSATMMNKGLEMIEAFHLFPLQPDQIDVLIHPQSVIHSMVEYVDGSTLAQLGSPDMRTPIAYCLAWPERMPAPSPKLDLAAMGRLDFENPDVERFPALKLARQCLEAGSEATTVLNAANEVAVAAFLNNRLGFLDIAHMVSAVLEKLDPKGTSTLKDVFELDREARAMTDQLIAETISKGN